MCISDKDECNRKVNVIEKEEQVAILSHGQHLVVGFAENGWVYIVK